MAGKRKFGEAQVTVSIRDRVGKGLAAIERRVTMFGKGLQSVGGGLSRAGTVGAAAFGAIGASLVAATTKFAAFGDNLDKMAARTGISVEALAELGFAAEQSGTDLTTVENATKRMSKSLFDAARGSATAVDSLSALGLAASDLQGLSPEDQFQAIADRLGQVSDASKRAAIAQNIFGRAGTSLLPMVQNMRELRQEARDLGIVLSKDDTNAAAALTDAMNRARRTIGGVVLQVGAALAPAMSNAADTIASLATNVIEFVRNNRQLIVSIAAGVAAGFALSVAVAGIGAAITTAGIVIASLGAIFTALGAAVAFVVSPLGLIIGGLVALTGLTLNASGGLGVLSQMFQSLGTTAVEAWGGIVAALSSGDLKTAGEIAFTALDVAWLTITTKMQQVWFGLVDMLKNIWLDVVKFIITTGANIHVGVAETFDKLTNAIIAGFDIAFTYIKGVVDGIITAIAKAIIQAQKFFGLLNAETAAGAQQILNDEFNKRAGNRQSGLDDRAAARGSRLAGRSAARRSNRSSFLDIVGQDLDRRRSSSSVDTSALDSAKKRLSALNAIAKEGAQGATTPNASQALPASLLASLTAGAQVQKTKAVGTSSAFAAASGFLGATGPEAETAQNTRETNRILRKISKDKGGFG